MPSRMEANEVDSLTPVESPTSPDVEDHRMEVLQGNLLLEHQPKSCTVRLFVSSDPEDSVWERCLFDRYVLPRLKHHCESLGLQFHLVNLEPVHKSPQEMIRKRELCLKEVKLSQQLSIGPSFVSLLSHRYGWRATPSVISKEDFPLLASCLASDDRQAHQLLLQWYTLDENRMPPAYVYNWNALRTASLQSWEVFGRSLRKTAKLLFGTKDKSKVQLFTVSTSEEEVTAGIFNCGAPGSEEQGNKCCWFKRVFSDMHSQKASDPAMMSYCDVMCDRCDVDQEAQKTLAHLKEARMTAKHIGLENTNIFEFPIKWAKGCGLDPQNDSTHSEYLHSLLTASTDFLQQKITAAAKWHREHSGPELYKEALFHSHLCQQKAKQFRVHRETLVKVHNYLNSPSSQPLVVSGLPGYGKSTLLAASARYLREKHSSRDMCIVIRFLGTTPQSATIRRTLQSVCQQLIAVYGSERAEPFIVPAFHDYQHAVHTFHHLLASLPHSDKPVYIFLDAVDELSAEDGAYSMSWVPGTIPQHVKLVLSTSSSKNCSCFTALQGVLHNNRQQLIEVPPLDEQSAEALLLSLIEEAGRTLTPNQKAVAMEAALQCPIPLFLALTAGTFDKLLHTDALLPRDMPHGLEEAVEGVLMEAESVCGRIAVERALGLIWCAKSGLTEGEMVDLLSLDDEVMACARGVSILSSSSSVPGETDQFPSLLWSRLLHSLLPSLLEFRRGEGDLLVLNLKHSVLCKVVRERYLESEEKRKQVFAQLSSYFSGKLQGGLHIQGEGQGERGQKVTECVDSSDVEEGDNSCSAVLENILGGRGSPFFSQPLWLGSASHLNHRKLVELPHALAQQGRVDELKKLLCSLQWQQATITGFSSSDLVAEFSNVVPVVPENKDQAVNSVELRIVREALRLSSAALSFSPKLLPQQLIGRLLPFVSDASVHRPLVTSLYEEAVAAITAPAIIPQQHLAETPDGPLLATLEGHRGPVSCVVCTHIPSATDTKQGALLLVTCSHDGTLKTWDLASLGVVQTLQAHEGAVLVVAATEDGKHAVSGGLDGTVRLWDLQAGQLLQTMVGHSDRVAAVALTADGEKALSASSDGSINVWSTDVRSRHCGELIFTLTGHSGVPLSVLVTVRGGCGWFVCGDCEGTLMLWDLVSGVVVQMVAAHKAEVTAAEVLWQQEGARPDVGSHLGSVRVISAARDFFLKLWDFPSGACLHSVQLTAVVTCLAATDADIFIAGAQDGSLSVWELDSCAPAYSLPKHSNQAVLGAAAVRDGWLAISAGEEGQVKIWDLLTRPLSTSPAHSGHVTCTRLSVCGSLVASGGQDGAVLVHTFAMGSRKFERALTLRGPVTGLAPFRDNKRLASSSFDGVVCIWDADTPGDVLELRGREGEHAAFMSVSVSWTGDYIAAGDVCGRVTVWESESGRWLKTLQDRSQAVTAVTFCESNVYQLLVSGDAEGTVCIRNLHDASFVQTIHLHIVGGVTCLRPQPGGSNIVAASSQDPRVTLWSLPDSHLLGTIDCCSMVNDVAVFSVKGSLHLLTACSDHTLRLWEVQEEERSLKAILPTDHLPQCCDVGSDGKSVVAVYGDSRGNVATAEICLEAVTDSFKEHLEGLQHLYPHATPSPCEKERMEHDSSSASQNEEESCMGPQSSKTTGSPPAMHHAPVHSRPKQNGCHHEGVHDDNSHPALLVPHTEASPASHSGGSSGVRDAKDSSPLDGHWNGDRQSHYDLEVGAGEDRDVGPKTGEQVVHSTELDSPAKSSNDASVAKATVLSKGEDKQLQGQQTTSSVCTLL